MNTKRFDVRGNYVALFGVCGGKGHAADICANIVSLLAYQAPAGDDILSGEEEGFMC